MDIFESAKRSVNRSLIEYYFRTEKAYWKNGEYWTLNPLRHDGNIGSFSISETGFYNDFASGQSGDIFSLMSEYFRISKKEAAEKIINETGGIIPENNYTPPREKKNIIKAVKLTPADRKLLEAEFIKSAESEYNLKDKEGNIYQLIKFYDYREYKTNLLMFYIARYECVDLKEKGLSYKKFHPFYYGEDKKIHQKMPVDLKPYPLYRINKTIGNDLPVIIVEGEKCAEVEIDNYILVTYSGGVNNLQNFDFTPLKTKNVYYWYDNDKQVYKEGHANAGEIMPKIEQPGYKAALKVKTEFLPQLVILDLDFLDKPDKWDIYDAKQEGIDLNQFIKDIIDKTKDNIKEFPPIDPYYAYKKFVSEIYGNENLIQIDGIMWNYLEDKHYWCQIMKENIFVDFQIWMEKSGAIQILDSMEKSKHSYKSQACSFIGNHGMEYYTDNYFKYSAISPYIHFLNGCIEVDEHGFKFFSRKDYDEKFFRGLYPVNCFDYEYKEHLQGKITFDNLRKYAPLFCHFVDSIIPPEIMKDADEVRKTYIFVFQIIAYCISPFKPNEYFFGLYGDQGSAKSSFFKLIALFIGKDFVVNRSFEDFKGNRFATSDLWNAKIYVDEDIAENQPLPDEFIKRNSGQVEISIEPKNKASIKGVSISLTMFFISNYEFKATGIEGIDRRAVIVHFKNQLPEKKRDKLILDRIRGLKSHDKKTPERDGETFDERPFILSMALESWLEFIDNSHIFTMPDWIKTSSDKMKSQMSSIGSFFNYILDGESGIDLTQVYTMKEYYEKYKEWCNEEGRRPKGRNKFYEDFLRIKNEDYFIAQERHGELGNIFRIKKKSKEVLTNNKHTDYDDLDDFEKLSRVF